MNRGLRSQSTYIRRVQSGVWRLPKYWPPAPSHSPPSECVLPPAPKAYTLAGRWGGGGSIFWKIPDIGLVFQYNPSRPPLIGQVACDVALLSPLLLTSLLLIHMWCQCSGSGLTMGQRIRIGKSESRQCGGGINTQPNRETASRVLYSIFESVLG